MQIKSNCKVPHTNWLRLGVFDVDDYFWLGRTGLNMPCDWAKTGEYPRIFANFPNSARREKDLKDNKDNSLHLERKYARIFVLGHYLFLVAHSFPQASLSENCSLLGTENVRGQTSQHIFAPNGGYCLLIPRSINMVGVRGTFWIVFIFSFLYFEAFLLTK